MTAFVLVSGALFRAPELKTSKAGKAYVTGTIKTRADDNRSEFWRITAFGETAQSVLMRLGEGDTIAAQGPMKCELYMPDGKEPRINLSIIADSVTPLRTARKATAKDSGSANSLRRSPQARAANGPDSDFRLRHHGGHSPDPALNDDPF